MASQNHVQVQVLSGDDGLGAANGTLRADSPCSLDSTSTIDDVFIKAKLHSQDVIDAVTPPNHRQHLLARLQAFAAAHPIFCVFLGLNIAITGVPLLVFAIFVTSVACSTFVVALFVSLLTAGFLTISCIGIALTILIPTICFTTFIACCLAFWVIVGYYVYQWIFGTADGPPKDSAASDKSIDAEVQQWSHEFRKIVDTSTEKAKDLAVAGETHDEP